MKSRIKSFYYAFKGIASLFRSEPNAWIHLVFAIAVISLGIYFDITVTEWCFAVLSITMVLAAEAFNTALEHLTDLVSPEYNELAGKSKDVSAGAVLIFAIGAATIGLIIFVPYFRALLRI